VLQPSCAGYLGSCRNEHSTTSLHWPRRHAAPLPVYDHSGTLRRLPMMADTTRVLTRDLRSCRPAASHISKLRNVATFPTSIPHHPPLIRHVLHSQALRPRHIARCSSRSTKRRHRLSRRRSLCSHRAEYYCSSQPSRTFLPYLSVAGDHPHVAPQNSLSGSQEVGVVISLLSCPSAAYCAATNASDRLGSTLYLGPYAPAYHSSAPLGAPPHQNFSVQVPTSMTAGLARLAVTHVSLIGVSDASKHPFHVTCANYESRRDHHRIWK
jgi:hypothetical protein